MIGANRRRSLVGGVVILVALVASIASGSDEKDKVLGTSGGTSTTAVNDSTSTGGSDTAPGTTGEKELPLTVESGMTSSQDSIGVRHTSAGALVTNPNKSLAAYDVDVLFNLKGSDGTVLDTDSSNVNYIAPGATVPVVPLQIGFDLKVEPASLDVVVTGDMREDKGWEGVEFMMGEGIELDVTGAAIAPGSYGNDLTAQVRNPSTDTVVEMATWDCVFRAGGKVVGGEGSGIADSIPPGVTVALDATLSVDIKAEEILCQAIG